MTLAIIVRKTRYCLYFLQKRGRKKPNKQTSFEHSSKPVRRWDLRVFQMNSENRPIISCPWKIAYVIQCFRYFAESRGSESGWWSSWFKGALERLTSHCLGAVVACCKDVFEDPFASPVVRGTLRRSWDPGAWCGATALCSTGESGRPWGQQGNPGAW